jgi:hypothetical protein
MRVENNLTGKICRSLNVDPGWIPLSQHFNRQLSPNSDRITLKSA